MAEKTPHHSSYDNLKTQLLLEVLGESLNILGSSARDFILGHIQISYRESLSKDCISISEAEMMLLPILGEGRALIIEDTKKRLDLLARSGVIIDCQLH